MNIAFKYSVALSLLLLGSVLPLLAHHPDAGNTIFQGTVDPFSSRSVGPASFGMVIVDGARGAKGDRNIYTTSLFLEAGIGEGLLSLNFAAPYLYYQQRDRKDAGRWGKPYIGGKLMPWRKELSPFYLILDGRIGAPTGSDTKRFIPGDYWDGALGLTAGFGVGRFGAGVRLGGQWPLSKLRNDGEERELRKVTELSLFASYQILSKLSLFAGVYGRTPFNGILWEDPGPPPNYIAEPVTPLQYYIKENYDPNPPLPKHYVEVSGGLTLGIGERVAVTVAYRHPLERRQNIRLYESVVSVAASVRFGRFHYHSEKKKKESDSVTEIQTQSN